MREFAKTVAVAVLLLVGMAAGTLVAPGLFALLSWIVFGVISHLFTSGDGLSTMPALLGLLLYALWIIGCVLSTFAGIVGGAAAAIWVARRLP